MIETMRLYEVHICTSATLFNLYFAPNITSSGDLTLKGASNHPFFGPTVIKHRINDVVSAFSMTFVFFEG